MPAFPIRRSTLLRILLVGSAVAAAIVLARRYLPDCETLQDFMKELGPFAPVGYVAASVFASLLFLPRTPLVVIAGMLFGIPGAAALDLGASLLGASAGFFLSRHFAREAFTRRLLSGAWRERAPWVESFLGSTETHGLSFVILIRVVHVFPFCPMNYLCGVLPVRYGPYLLGTLIGLLPGTFALAYCGNVFGCMLVDDEAAIPRELKIKLVAGAAVLALVTLIPAWWAHRRARAQKMGGPGPARGRNRVH